MKAKKNLILAAIALVFVVNVILAIVSRPDAEVTSEPDKDAIVDHIPEVPASSSEVAAGEENWKGWQDAVIVGDGVQLFSDRPLTQPIDTEIADGTAVVICEKVDDLCRVRCGSATGWMAEAQLKTIGSPVVYSEKQSASEPADIAETDTGKKLEEIAQNHGCVGVQVAVVNNGRITHHYEYGWQDKKEKVPVSMDTKIRVASISKVVVGMGVMSMRDMGILSIDEDISKYWGTDIKNPNFPDDPITFRNIFTHTSSMTDFGYKKRATSALEENLGKKSSYMKIKPGDIGAYDYNNSAMCTSGAVAGRAANINFDQYIREYFFEPLGIDASFHVSNIAAADKISIVYNDGVPTIRVDDQFNYKFYGGVGDDYSFYSGGLVISACDYAKMICVLLGGGEYEQMYYLKQQSIDDMLTKYYKLDDYDQCLVLRHRENMFGGRSLYYHNGNMAGVYSLMCFDTATGDGMVIISNGSKEPKMQNGVYSVCGELAEAAAQLWAE